MWSRVRLTLRRTFRGARVVALGALVYSAGYSAGTSSFGADPERFREMALEDTLLRLGSPRILPKSTRFHQTADKVLEKILAAAEEHLRAQVEKGLVAEEELERLLKPLRRPWEIVVVEHPLPNAFVNPLLPDKLFVHSGLLRHGRGEAAVALGIASELLTSVMNSDPHRNMRMSAYAATGQMVVLAMLDPTGLLTLSAEAIMLLLHEYGPPLPVLFRKLNLHKDPGTGFEVDADGLKIVARAGYPPAAALRFLELLQDVENLQVDHRHNEATEKKAEVKSGKREEFSSSSYLPSVINQFEDTGTSRRTYWQWFQRPAPTGDRLEALRELAEPDGGATALYLGAMEKKRQREREAKTKGREQSRPAEPLRLPVVSSILEGLGNVGRRASDMMQPSIPAVDSGTSQAEVVGWSAALLLVFAAAEAFNRK